MESKSLMSLINKNQNFPLENEYINKELKKKISFRTYTVAEEKDLLISRASGDWELYEKSCISLIENCGKVKNLIKYPKFLIAEMAKFLRIISYSDKIEFTWDCEHCGNSSQAETIHLKEYNILPENKEMFLKMPNYTIFFQYLSYEDEFEIDTNSEKNLPNDWKIKKEDKEIRKIIRENSIDKNYEIIARMIKEVKTDTQTFSNVPLEQKKEFIFSLDKKTFEEILDKINNLDLKPLTLEKNCICESCKQESNIIIGNGVSSFFEF